MKNIYCAFALLFCLATASISTAQPYFQSTATIDGNNILYKIKAISGPITTGWSDIEFFFRNSTAAPDADAEFDAATITVNTADFPGVSIPYNGKNIQGVETGYTNYWFGISFNPTTPKTYNQNQEYLVCTIALSVSPAGFDLELCHNEPNFVPHYVVLTDPGGGDLTNLTGTNKFYGPDTVICNPNCPVSTPGNNHILPLNGAQPVELIDFQARKYAPQAARLDWRTAVEIDFDMFEIESQRNGRWEKIGMEQGRADHGGGATYTFFDHDPPEPTAYYRLKMVDYDGSFAYSPIRSVAFGGDNTIRIFPNPTTDVLHLAFGTAMRADMLLVELVDWSGRVVVQKQLNVSPGATETLALGDYRLPAGIYLCRAGTANGFRFCRSVAIQF
ncbi:MAG: T9SS type A sorting domain-containing protein [Lewinellaceae bacterium]|nr:T9SS type A sorting domain-containing protein [Lewinellaceae bacterium]